MSIQRADGTRVTSSTIATGAIDPLDQPKVLTEDLYETRRYGLYDNEPEGSIKVLAFRAGAVLTQRQIDALFKAPKVAAISPDQGGAAGGEVVTITGNDLDGVTAVKFGATAGTALTIVSDRELEVTTPAGVAGAVDVVLTGDTGDVTVTGGYTYV